MTGPWFNEIRYEAGRLFAPGGRRHVVLVALGLAAFAAGASADWRAFQRRATAALAAEGDRLHRLYRADADRALAEASAAGLSSPLHPVSVYWKRVHVAEPPAASSVLAVGQSDLLPYYAVFNGVEDQVLHFAAEIRNPVHLALGGLDLAFWAAMLLPLLIIALAFDLASEEREAGRLPLLGLSAIGLRRLFLVRLCFRFALVAVVSLAAAGATLAAVAGSTFSWADTSRVLAAAGLAVLHLLFWAAAAFWVASRGLSSVFGAASLVAAWIVLAFALPALLQTRAEARFPIPSRNHEAVAVVVRQAESDGERKAALRAMRAERPDLAGSGDPSRKAAVEIAWYPAFLAYQRAVSRRAAAAEDGFRRQLRAQEDWIDRFRFVSPPLMLGRALSRLADSDLPARIAFLDRLEEYRARRRDAVLGKLFRNEIVTPAEVEAFPRYEGRPPPLGGWSLIADAAWLAAATGLLLLAGWRRFGRPDP